MPRRRRLDPQLTPVARERAKCLPSMGQSIQLLVTPLAANPLRIRTYRGRALITVHVDTPIPLLFSTETNGRNPGKNITQK